MRRLALFIFVLIIAISFIYFLSESETISTELKDYYIANAFEETGAENLVTAVYLNYRILDTFYEALMLLVSVFAIVYFSRYKGGYDNYDGKF